jgi:uncharacterized membrane protein
VIRGLLRLGLVGVVLGWIADTALRRSAAGDAPRPFRSLVVIDAPIERVWMELADIEGQPRWMHEMKSVRMLTPPPVGAGSRGVATVRIFGLGVTDPVEITEFAPPTRFAIRHEGTFTGGGVITLESGADRTTTIVRWDETLIAPALPHLWAAMAAPVMESIFQADLRRFRDLVEAGATPDPAGG